MTDILVQNFKIRFQQWPKRWECLKNWREITLKNSRLLIFAARKNFEKLVSPELVLSYFLIS
jgi:hypothetical protein